MTRWHTIWLAVCVLSACNTSTPSAGDGAGSPSPRASDAAIPSSAGSPGPGPERLGSQEPSSKQSASPDEGSGAPDGQQYAWLSVDSIRSPKAVTTLLKGTPTPPGYARAELEPGSFGAWLRHLPLAAPGTPVLDWRGGEVRSGQDEYIEAIVAIDVGRGDLQQSPDVILRFHAEWQWSLGRRNHSYAAATKDPVAYDKWIQGQRILARDNHLYWIQKTDPSPPDDYRAFREYLSTVFLWLESTAVRMQSTPVPANDVQPGDFFLQRSKPNHLAIVLDIAHKDGKRLALIGQALSPATNVHVIRPGRSTPWFSLRPPENVLTSEGELQWEELRRLKPSPAL